MTTLVNSADSHVLEPADLWRRELPPSMRDRGPVTETAGEREIVSVDGTVVRRDPVAFMEAIRPPGAHDPAARLADLDEQGIWAELIFPSRALWVHLVSSRRTRACTCRSWSRAGPGCPRSWNGWTRRSGSTARSSCGRGCPSRPCHDH